MGPSLRPFRLASLSGDPRAGSGGHELHPSARDLGSRGMARAGSSFTAIRAILRELTSAPCGILRVEPLSRHCLASHPGPPRGTATARARPTAPTIGLPGWA